MKVRVHQGRTAAPIDCLSYTYLPYFYMLAFDNLI